MSSIWMKCWWPENSCSHCVRYLWHKTRKFLNIHQKTKSTKKDPNGFIRYGSTVQLCQRKLLPFRGILRRSNNFFSTSNGPFWSYKESDIEFNFTGFSKIKIMAWIFHVLPEKTKSSVWCNHRSWFDEIITNGCSLLRRLGSMGRYSTAHAEKSKIENGWTLI